MAWVQASNTKKELGTNRLNQTKDVVLWKFDGYVHFVCVCTCTCSCTCVDRYLCVYVCPWVAEDTWDVGFFGGTFHLYLGKQDLA